MSCARREAVCGDAAANVNVVMFRDQDWADPASPIALTTPSAGVSSGLIIDADLELNSTRYAFSLDGSATDAFRLPDVLAHEVGHFLGLSHSDQQGALMAEDYASLLLSRELLTPDDVAAICAAYPPGGALECAAPASPANDQCQRAASEAPPCALQPMTHDNQGGGCSLAGASQPAGSSGSWLLVALALALGRRSNAHLRRRSSGLGSAAVR